jgi:tagatose 1,6-diphosphate aldolase
MPGSAGLPSGKFVSLRRLADEAGRFKMLAVDQRGSLEKALQKAMGREPDYQDIARVKQIITKTLAPQATAVLMDPIYGHPYSVVDIPRDVAILLACEESGYEKAGAHEKERKSHLLDGWSVEKVKRSGANAAKLLIYYQPDASVDTRTHQQALVRRVGEACVEHDLPFLLELVCYAIAEPTEDSPEFAQAKPNLVIRSAAEFSRPEYHVDLLKLEFPAMLKYTEKYSQKALDDRAREPVYSLAQVRTFCQQLDKAATVPWVILSAGVDIKEFLIQLELACAAGASGFLCGRAIWKGSIAKYPDGKAMEDFLQSEGIYNFKRANAAAEAALPWYQHRRFRGRVELAGQNPAWCREYARCEER